MRWYVDTSLALHAAFPWGDPRVDTWLHAIHARGDELFSSALFELELVRGLRRERLDLALAQAVLKRFNLAAIDDGVLRFAAAIEPRIRSLDAIHLATCALLGTGITLATHDANMAEVAASLGLDTFDPLA